MFSSLWLGARNLTMIVLFPGTVAVYIPYRLLSPVKLPSLAAWSVGHYIGISPNLVGVPSLPSTKPDISSLLGSTDTFEIQCTLE